MGIALTVVQQAYEAFRRQDVPAVLDLVAAEVDWDFIGSANLPYSGRRRSRAEVAEFFAAVGRAEDIHAFESRNFIEADEHVTVLGWMKATARDTQKTYETEWVHVVTVRDGKIIHWRGFANTAARYGV
jgi:ketosteroid isomerase-like protein